MKQRTVRALGCLILAVAVAAVCRRIVGYSKTGVSDQQKSTDITSVSATRACPCGDPKCKSTAGHGEVERLHESPRVRSPSRPRTPWHAVQQAAWAAIGKA
jgi:hypothetical protein